MGRASRRNKERRERLAASGRKESYRAIRRGHNAEMFGRTVGGDLGDFEAVGRRGQDSLAAALISRHNQRMQRVGEVYPSLRKRSRIIVSQLGVIWYDLRKLGADPDRPPVSRHGSWIDQLAWGVDSMVATIRLLLCGQVIGAAQVARSQLERWTLNIEHSAYTSRKPGESTVDYYDRLWADGGRLPFAVTAKPTSRFRHVVAGDRQVRPGQLYQDISELLHGRGTGVEAVIAEASELLADIRVLSSQEVIKASNQVLDAVELCIQRIVLFVAGMFNAIEEYDRSEGLYKFIAAAHPSGDWSYPQITLWPLIPHGGANVFQFARLLRQSEELAEAILRGETPAGRLYRDEEMSNIFFAYRRYCAVKLAVYAYGQEAEALGKPVESLDLSDRHYNQIIVAETMGLIARWSADEYVRAAAAVVSSGLRSAFWLWLEDDDRAMGVLRVVLEQCARLRTHVRKPPKARRLEGRGELTTPRDWLDAAGWRQLNALNKALGELAHTRRTSKWDRAREVLVALQPDVESELAPHRGRTFAVEAVIRLASRTALEVLQGISPTLRDHVHSLMTNTGVFNDVVEQRINEWLSRSHALRDFDYGRSDLSGSSDACGVP